MVPLSLPLELSVAQKVNGTILTCVPRKLPPRGQSGLKLRLSSPTTISKCVLLRSRDKSAHAGLVSGEGTRRKPYLEHTKKKCSLFFKLDPSVRQSNKFQGNCLP